jgi:hypothetical protein
MTPEGLLERKLTRIWDTSKEWRQDDVDVITHAFLLCIRSVGKARKWQTKRKGWMGEKSYLVTIDTGHQWRPSGQILLQNCQKRNWPGQTSCRWHKVDPSHLEGGASGTDSYVDPPSNFAFVIEVTNEIFLGLDVLRTHDASMDLGCHILWLGQEESPLLCPSERSHSSPHMKDRSDVVLTWRRRVMTVCLGNPQEVVDNLVGMGSKAAHQAGVCGMSAC